MRNQDNENLTKELKGESPMPVPYARGKVNATADTLAPAFVMKKARAINNAAPVVTYRVREDAIFGCLKATGLVNLGLLSLLEAHRLGLTERV